MAGACITEVCGGDLLRRLMANLFLARIDQTPSESDFHRTQQTNIDKTCRTFKCRPYDYVD